MKPDHLEHVNTFSILFSPSLVSFRVIILSLADDDKPGKRTRPVTILDGRGVLWDRWAWLGSLKARLRPFLLFLLSVPLPFHLSDALSSRCHWLLD